MKCPACNLSIGVINSAKLAINLALRKPMPCPHCNAAINQQTNPTWEHFKFIIFVIFWLGLILFLIALLFGRQVGYESALKICFWLWIILIVVFVLIVLCDLAVIFLRKITGSKEI